MQTLGAFIPRASPAPAGRYIGSHYQPPDPAEVFAPPRTDVQAALTVVGRRQRDFDRPIDRPVLTSVNLTGYDLSDGDFTGANFRGTYLCNAVLNGARLAAANFDYANLERADFFGADCMGRRSPAPPHRVPASPMRGSTAPIWWRRICGPPISHAPVSRMPPRRRQL